MDCPMFSSHSETTALLVTLNQGVSHQGDGLCGTLQGDGTSGPNSEVGEGGEPYMCRHTDGASCVLSARPFPSKGAWLACGFFSSNTIQCSIPQLTANSIAKSLNLVPRARKPWSENHGKWVGGSPWEREGHLWDLCGPASSPSLQLNQKSRKSCGSLIPQDRLHK